MNVFIAAAQRGRGLDGILHGMASVVGRECEAK